jgi:hypothetical protein
LANAGLPDEVSKKRHPAEREDNPKGRKSFSVFRGSGCHCVCARYLNGNGRARQIDDFDCEAESARVGVAQKLE